MNHYQPSMSFWFYDYENDMHQEISKTMSWCAEFGNLTNKDPLVGKRVILTEEGVDDKLVGVVEAVGTKHSYEWLIRFNDGYGLLDTMRTFSNIEVI